jgi:hypothetical protein
MYGNTTSGCFPCSGGGGASYGCDCQLGQYGTSPNCNWCGLGSYSDTINAVECTLCPSPNVGAHSGLETSDCSYLCEEGYYCPFDGTNPANLSTIIACATYATSFAGSSTREDCYCGTLGRSGNGWQSCDGNLKHPCRLLVVISL